jgi:gliding motility-associated-like protein
LSIDADGTLTVAPNTPSGTYTITYELCEVGATPANCDTAIATVVVGNPIVANDDTIASTGGNVLSNDTLNGAAVTTTNTDVTPVTSGPLSIDADGTLTVAPNTPSGTYTITYKLCEVGATPANCDTAIATVVVDNPIVANDDLVGPIVSSTTATTNVVSVLANDTFNGNPLVLVDVNLTVVNPNPNLRLNADGSVDVLGNTPAGTYVLTYQICEKAYPSNCQTATVTVIVVAPVIVATNDDYSNQPIDSSKGTVLDILANDRLNNGTVSAPQVVITIVDANGIAGVTVDAQGKVTIPTGTPVGTYLITYRICDVVNPNNCATATITIVVKDPCDFDDSASSCDILVHNAFSPNNDGRNEVFLIERIENYPDNTVEIYNRWGVLVFEVSGYDNASKVFVGLSEGRVTVNKADALPNGTYYYVVKYKKPMSGVMNQKAGFLYLSR